MMDFIKDYITIIISVSSIILSIVNMFFVRKDRAKDKAPILEINKSCYNGSRYEFPNVIAQLDKEREDFILDRRLFRDKNDNTIDSNYSLLIDTDVQNKNYIESIGFDTIIIKNIGFSLSKISIEKIVFKNELNEEKILIASKRNKLLLNMHKGDEITVLISGRFATSGYQPLNTEKLNDINGEYADRLSKIKGTNLLNTRCISEADNWTSILISIKTENVYGQKYIQEVHFSIENNTYYMKTSKAKLICK